MKHPISPLGKRPVVLVIEADGGTELIEGAGLGISTDGGCITPGEGHTLEGTGI